MANVLVVGGGGREHALAWKLRQSSQADNVFVAPGNAADCVNADLIIDDAREVIKFCERENISLVVIGPEAPLAAGLVDELHKLKPDLLVFGPVRQAAMLETSKIYAKHFMEEFKLFTAGYKIVESEKELDQFLSSMNNKWGGIVVKADGLAAGKGVVVAKDVDEARSAAKAMLDGEFGDSGKRLLLEEKLDGYEISALAFVDGNTFARMPLVRDHKRLLNGDRGPNTGGMGVVAPVHVSKELNRRIDEIFERTIAGLKSRGISYKGVLYAGLMVCGDTPYLLEYNCRFGDPETQVLMRLLDSDLLKICQCIANGELSKADMKWSDKKCCGVVLSGAHYPKSSDRGTPITYVPENTNIVHVFHAGTALRDNKLITNGGRIFCVTAIGETLDRAREMANSVAEMVKFEGKHFRTDIGCAAEKKAMSYGSSGVNIDEGNAFVEDIKGLVQKTLQPGASQIGGFGAIMDLKDSGFTGDLQLVMGIDGVGTKLEVASIMNDYSGIGHDVVAMCVNDVLCHCARPIAFLDYFVCGKLDRRMATQVMSSVSEACVEAGCSLVGGETAEMPGVYGVHQWDLAGCAIACRERDWPLLPAADSIREGDILLGLPSSGLHSNGFSLVRRIMNVNKIDYFQPTPWDPSLNFGQAFLKGTRIYVRSVFPLLKSGLVKGCAHITGGGLVENAPRMLSKKSNLKMMIDCTTWRPPPMFQWLAGIGPVEIKEMMRTFNCGIGMVLAVSPDKLQVIERELKSSRMEFLQIGRVEKRASDDDEFVDFRNEMNLFDFQTYKTTRRRVKVGILISGTGTNMKKLIERASRADSNCEIAVVVSNKEDAKGLGTARKMGIPTSVVQHTEDRVTGDKELAKCLQAYGVELICLGGYMRILSPGFVKKYPQRIINIHPSLLPAFKGSHALRDALHFGAKVVGCTAHYVDEQVDHGEVIAQKAVAVEENDTHESLQKKLQREEHIMFPEVMLAVAENMLRSEF